MELVYLWVEDYKNIQKQGFNFSPRFDCDYNEDTKELSIDENDDYIEDFFGENINVTAIVGKNGSGKSSVLNFVRLFLEESYRIEKKAILIFHNRKDEFIPFTLNYGDDLLKFKSKDIANYDNDILNEKNALIDTIFPFFDYSLTYEKSASGRRRKKLEGFIPEGIEKNNENKKEVEKKLVRIFPTFPKKDTNSLDFFREDMDNLTKIIANYQVMTNKQVFEDFFIPHTLILTISKSKITKVYNPTAKENPLEINYIGNDEKLLQETFLSFHAINENLLNIDTNFLIDLYKKGDNKIKILPQLIGAYQHDIMKFDISKLNEIEIKYLLELAKTDMFKVSLLDGNNKRLEDLSFGEQQLLKILNIVYYLANNNENIIFFFDEIDIGLHPEWQKKIFKYIIDILLQFPEKRFHLILSSHSPFLLSDIPKENILFIKGQLEHKQTFGANIHTLLSDSFFMEDGLMGEFAKGKINEIIDFFNNKNNIYEDDKKKLKQIIETIGEAFLKDKLLHMYNEKYPKTDEEKIKDLEQEIESIKNG